MQNSIHIEKRGAVVCVRLNRPESMNALSLASLEELDRALAQIGKDKTLKVCLLTGAGKAFCAGGDLQSFRQDVQAADWEALAYKLRYAQEVFQRLESLPLVTIAVVNGYAIAGGLELLLCCDIVLAAEHARIGDGHVRYGVIPGGGSSARLPRKIAQNQANYVLLSGALLPASQWQQWGLVQHVYPAEQLNVEAWQLAETIATHSAVGLQHIKQLAQASMGLSTAQACEQELEHFARYAQSADFAEGLQAFAEKREPVFSALRN